MKCLTLWINIPQSHTLMQSFGINEFSGANLITTPNYNSLLDKLQITKLSPTSGDHLPFII